MSSVLQPWVMEMGWKQQSILMSGFRGPDFRNVPALKIVNRWLRTVSQNNADPSKNYMKQAELPNEYALCDDLEFLPAHFVHHFADALRVLALHHPDESVRHRAYVYHFRIAEELFHFVPEEDQIFLIRHRDKVEHA